MSKNTVMVFYHMPFASRLANLRKLRGHTQESLAETIGMTKTQIYRYETGTSQPTLDVIKKLAIALSVTADELIFEEGERTPDDDMLHLIDSISKLDPDEKNVIKEIIESVLLKHQAKQIMKRSDQK